MSEVQCDVRRARRRLLGSHEGDDMASKDKGGRSSKTVAAKTPKEKKEAKRAKKQAKDRDGRAV